MSDRRNDAGRETSHLWGEVGDAEEQGSEWDVSPLDSDMEESCTAKATFE